MVKQVVKLHITDVQRFKQCRTMWHWASPLRGNLTHKVKYAPFLTGSLVHHCLEMKYRIGQDAKSAVEAYLAANCTQAEQQDPKVIEQANLVVALMAHYDLWQKYDQSELADQGFEFVDPEHAFNYRLWANYRYDVMLSGTYDGVVKSLTTGKTYLWEIKTTRSVIERERQLALDAQTDAYCNSASEVLGIPIDGIVYTLIKKDIPKEPKRLQTGMLSQDKSQTLPAYYYLACVKANHKAELAAIASKAPAESMIRQAQNDWIKANYGDFINLLATNENSYFKRVLVTRSEADLKDAQQELIAVSKEMISPKTAIYRNESYSCNYCQFRAPCIAKRAGQDYQRILVDNFEPNQRYLDEIEA